MQDSKHPKNPFFSLYYQGSSANFKHCRSVGFFIIYLFIFTLGYAQSGSEEQLAERYYFNGEKEKALELYQSLYNKNPSTYIYNRYLKILLEEKDFKTAEKMVKSQLKRTKNNPLVAIDLGRVYTLAGENAKAEKQYAGIVQSIKKDNYQIHEIAQYFYTEVGSYSWAIEIYLKARKEMGDPSAYAFELANLYRITQQIPEMMNEYLDFLEENTPLLSYVQESLQSLLAEEKNTAATTEKMKKVLFQRAQKDPNSILIQDFILWIFLQEKDFEAALNHAKNYQIRFKDLGGKIYEVSKVAEQNGAFAKASEGYRILISLGTTSPYFMLSKIALQEIYFEEFKADWLNPKKNKNELLAGLDAKEQEITTNFPKNEQTLKIYKGLAQLYAYYGQKPEKASEILESFIKMPTLNATQKAECKIELADILLYTDDVWEASLLYSQVEKDFKQDPIGFTAKFKNAMLSYYIGEFLWAKSQLDVLKAATSKLIANDAMDLSLLIKEHINADSNFAGLFYLAKADMMIYRELYAQADLFLDTLLGMSGEEALRDDALFRKGKIQCTYMHYEKAVQIFEEIYTMDSLGIMADDALWEAGLLYEIQLNNPTLAKEKYEKIFMNFPSSILANQARTRYRLVGK